MTYPGYSYYGPPGPHRFGPPAPAPAPAYGYAPPPETGVDSRYFPLLIGWIAAFLMPAIYCVLRYALFGLDLVGMILVAAFVGPIFFGAQCCLNLITLGIPRRCRDSLLFYWSGMLVWWGGVGAICLVPGWEYREEIRELGDKAWIDYENGNEAFFDSADGERYLDILESWMSSDGNLQQSLTIPSIVALVGAAIVLIGVVVAAQNAVRPGMTQSPYWPGTMR